MICSVVKKNPFLKNHLMPYRGSSIRTTYNLPAYIAIYIPIKIFFLCTAYLPNHPIDPKDNRVD